MKIINVISDSNIAGAGNVLLTYLRSCDRGRFDLSVALPRGSALKAEVEVLGFPCYEVEGIAEKSFSLRGVRELRGLFVKVRPDIVHTHASLSARVAAHFVKAKIVYTRHSVFPNKWALTVFPGKPIAGLVNNFLADKIVAVSPAAKDNIVETGVRADKVVIIYNGVDPLPSFSPEEKKKVREEYALPGEAFLCGIFARLTAVKGHEYILDAARILKDQDIFIAIAGWPGESEALIKERIQRENLVNVKVIGFVNKPGRLIAALDLQLNASYGTEATSLSLLEGMSAGVPAVVSSFGGNPYVIEDGVNGFVTPQKDGGAIAEAILKLRGDADLYNRMSASSKMVYAKRFTAEVSARELERVYLAL